MKRYIKSAVKDLLDTSFETRRAVLFDENASIRDLIKLAEDRNPMIRYNLATSDRCPIEILEKLASDEDEDVRTAAIIQLCARTREN